MSRIPRGRDTGVGAWYLTNNSGYLRCVRGRVALWHHDCWPFFPQRQQLFVIACSRYSRAYPRWRIAHPESDLLSRSDSLARSDSLVPHLMCADIVKAPWEENPSSPEGDEISAAGSAAATAAATAAAAAATAAADGVGDGSVFPPGAFERRTSASAFSTDGQVRLDVRANAGAIWRRRKRPLPRTVSSHLCVHFRVWQPM